MSTAVFNDQDDQPFDQRLEMTDVETARPDVPVATLRAAAQLGKTT
ncbi:MAG: hypothetical protein GY717_04565 [Rhodobacteraceae bacterium]|nr:hypothetical protein [Paracoccaceae bacterium]